MCRKSIENTTQRKKNCKVRAGERHETSVNQRKKKYFATNQVLLAIIIEIIAIAFECNAVSAIVPKNSIENALQSLHSLTTLADDDEVNKNFVESGRASRFFQNVYGAPAYGYPPVQSPIANVQKCDCGRSNRHLRPEAKIINGTMTRPHEYPWMAIITNKGQYLCSGSLITDFHIITAAHCLKPEIIRDDLKVILGQYNNCEENSDTVTFSVSDFIRHSRFNPETYAYDLMLIKVNMRVTFGQYIRPICLPPLDIYQRTVTKKYKGEEGVIVGWGTTSVYDDTTLSCLPLQVVVPILGLESCPGYDESLFCAGYLDGTADSCQGDSGGPLQILNKRNRYDIIGIISSGEGCAVAGRPGLYSDILQNLNWIYKRIADASCASQPHNIIYY